MIPNIEIYISKPCWQWIDYDFGPAPYDTLEPFTRMASIERREILVTEI